MISCAGDPFLALVDHFPDLNNPKMKRGGTGAQAARQIANRLDRIPHSVYVEPFLGRGDVFRAKRPAGKDYLNDLDCKRVRQAKRVACRMAKRETCERIRSAKVSCGRDWKSMLRHDSPSTLFFLDPPWDGIRDERQLPYRLKVKRVTAAQVVEKTRGLKGAVEVYYKNRPEFRRVLCRAPFRCSAIHGNILGHRYTQILAVKPGGSHVSRELRGKTVPEEPWGDGLQNGLPKNIRLTVAGIP